MIAASKHRNAGITISSGALLFFLAAVINLLYSMPSACFDSLPAKCFTGFDSLPSEEQAFLSVGLYAIGLIVLAAGCGLWIAENAKPRAEIA